MRRPIPTPPHVDVWDEFEQDFVQDWDDTNAHYKVAAELDKLKMEGSNIDHYITKFAELARKAQYHKDDPAVLKKFKHGLYHGTLVFTYFYLYFAYYVIRSRHLVCT